jgi:hypothetical protein
LCYPPPELTHEKKVLKNQRTWKKTSGKNHRSFLENWRVFEGFEISGTDWYFDSDSLKKYPGTTRQFFDSGFFEIPGTGGSLKIKEPHNTANIPGAYFYIN